MRILRRNVIAFTIRVLRNLFSFRAQNIFLR